MSRRGKKGINKRFFSRTELIRLLCISHDVRLLTFAAYKLLKAKAVVRRGLTHVSQYLTENIVILELDLMKYSTPAINLLHFSLSYLASHKVDYINKVVFLRLYVFHIVRNCRYQFCVALQIRWHFPFSLELAEWWFFSCSTLSNKIYGPNERKQKCQTLSGWCPMVQSL